jgi:hypothetical protein
MSMYVLQLQAGAPTTTDLQTYLTQNVADAGSRQQLQQDGRRIDAALATSDVPAEMKTIYLGVTADPVIAYDCGGLIVPAMAFVDAPGSNAPPALQTLIANVNGMLKRESSYVAPSVSPGDAILQIALDLDDLRTRRLTVADYVDALEGVDARVVDIAKKGTADVQESVIASAMAARRLTTAAYASLLERVTETAERHTTTATFAL